MSENVLIAESKSTSWYVIRIFKKSLIHKREITLAILFSFYISLNITKFHIHLQNVRKSENIYEVDPTQTDVKRELLTEKFTVLVRNILEV